MNRRLMETKLDTISTEELETAMLTLIEHHVNLRIDPSDLAVEIACELEDSGRYGPVAIWPWNDVDDQLEYMDPSDIIDAVETGENDPAKYWRRIGPDNQMESYDDGHEVTEKAMEIVAENLGEYLDRYGKTGRDTILDMLGIEIDYLCDELGIDEEIEPDSVTVQNMAGDEIDIDDDDPISLQVYDEICDCMLFEYRHMIQDMDDDLYGKDFLAAYLTIDDDLPRRTENRYGIIITIDQ